MSNPSASIQTMLSGYSASLGANTTFDTSGYIYASYFDKTTAGPSLTLTTVKIDISAGTVVWSTGTPISGFAGEDIDPVICLDGQRNVYIAFTTVGHTSETTNLGQQDVVLVKLNASGAYQWSIPTTGQISTAANDLNPYVAYDSVYNAIYLTYETASVTPGDKDIVLTRLTTAGAKVWQRTIGTTAEESSAQITITPRGGIVLTLSTKGALGGALTGVSDIVVTMYDVSNNELWKKQDYTFNTVGTNTTPVTAVDANENIYCAYVTTTETAGYNLELFKLTRNGYLAWWFSDAVINTSADDIQPSLAVDTYGYLYLAYTSKGTGVNSGAMDVVVVKMRSDDHTAIWKEIYSQQSGRNNYQPVIYMGPSDRMFVAYLHDNASGGTDIGVINMTQTITNTTNILTAPMPPYAPVLTKTANSGLLWTVPAGSVGSYKIYTVSNGVYTLYATKTSATTTVANAELRVGTYSYAVTAIDATLGFASEYSNTVGPITVVETSPFVPCFLAAAPVLTPTGYRRISKLAVGDLVRTADGRNVAVKRIVVKRVAAGPGTNPYSIPAGYLGAERRLLISPNHRVVTADGSLVEARHLGLAQEKMSGEFDYYNVELENWQTDHMVVAGVAVESLAPVRRVTVSMETLRRELVRKYGAITPSVANMIRATCQLVGEDRVSVPVLPRH